MIKVIIFDFGGVLIDNPADGMLSFYAKHFGMNKEDFVAVYAPYESSWTKGQISEDELWEKVCKELSVQKPTSASLWFDGFMDIYRKKDEVFSLVETLQQKGYPLALLSNTEVPIMNFIKAQEWDELFTMSIYSCEVGMQKPERDIYAYTLEQFHILSQEAVFVDDKAENIEAAKRVGMKGIVFKNIKQLKKDLHTLRVNY